MIKKVVRLFLNLDQRKKSGRPQPKRRLMVKIWGKLGSPLGLGVGQLGLGLDLELDCVLPLLVLVMEVSARKSVVLGRSLQLTKVGCQLTLEEMLLMVVRKLADIGNLEKSPPDER
jgi:hypothetical protein